jgi:hypothetical protein
MKGVEMKKKVFLVCAALVISVTTAFAEVITFTSGSQIEAPIVERDETTVIVELEGVRVPYFLNEIDKIDEEAISHIPPTQVSVDQPVQPEASAGASMDNTGSSSVIPDPSGTNIQSENSSISSSPADEKGKSLGDVAKSALSDKRNSRLLGAAASGIVLLVILIISVGIYVYSSLCMAFIAQKTNQGPIWMAWVPVAQLMLMFKVANLSYWWLLIFFASFVPLIGALAVLAFSGYLYYKVALARNKPGWVGLLMLLPLANLVVLGYLAFSE